MRVCRERRSVVKYTFSRQSRPFPPRAPVLCHTPRLRLSRASKTFGCTKRVGGVASVLKWEGTRDLKSRPSRRGALDFVASRRKPPHFSPRRLESQVQRLCVSASLSPGEIPHHNPVYFAVPKVTTPTCLPVASRAHHFSNFHFLRLPSTYCDETPRDR